MIPKTERNRLLVELYTTCGLSYSEIGRVFRLSKQTVREIIRREVARSNG